MPSGSKYVSKRHLNQKLVNKLYVVNKVSTQRAQREQRTQRAQRAQITQLSFR